MRLLNRWLVLTSCVAALACGCTTTQKTQAFTTLDATAKTVDTARQVYAELIVTGKVTPIQQVTIDGYVNDYQMAMRQAIIVAKADLSQPTPENVGEIAEVIITTVMHFARE